MNLTGHVLIGHDGAILEADDGFADLLRADTTTIPGRRVLDVTAPADREECCRALDGLRATRRPFSIVKRFICDDASPIWVRNSVSIMVSSRPDLVVPSFSCPDGGRD
jgi:PAS domain-containing protein